MPDPAAPAVLTVRPGPLRAAEIRVPGDKSISHRAILLGAMADGTTRVRGLLRSEDVDATIRAVRQAGITVEETPAEIRVHGSDRWQGAADDWGDIDCGNSGTTCRLLMGALAGQAAASLTGDASLQRRPMGRVIRPLRAMGADIDGGPLLPVRLRRAPLHGVTWSAEVASAQVKSAVLLAGLRAAGPTTYLEPIPTRDHTERFLRAMGADLRIAPAGSGHAITVRPGPLRPLDLDVPGDISSAAFWLVAASLIPGAVLRLPNVGVNPARTGVIDALRRMGADIALAPRPGFEPVADIVVRHAPLRATTIGGAEIPALIDEIPVLAVAAAFAEGDTLIRDAAELRVKESDRVRSTLDLLRAIGIAAEEFPDGLLIHGNPDLQPCGARVHSRGDHRIAMAAAIAGLRVGCAVEDTGCIATSYPEFIDLI